MKKREWIGWGIAIMLCFVFSFGGHLLLSTFWKVRPDWFNLSFGVAIGLVVLSIRFWLNYRHGI